LRSGVETPRHMVLKTCPSGGTLSKSIGDITEAKLRIQNLSAYVETLQAKYWLRLAAGRRIRDWETQPDWPQIVPEVGVSANRGRCSRQMRPSRAINVGGLT